MNAKSANLLFALSIVGFGSLFALGANAQSVGQACGVNGRTQMSATASEGLIQCRSGTWASASQTVSSGGSSTPITAIMQYEKTLVTTVDACTDAMVGFKGFNPRTGKTMICGGATFGWKPEIPVGLPIHEKCTLVTSDSIISFTDVELSGCNGSQWCVFVNPRVTINGTQRAPAAEYRATDQYCKQLGFTRSTYSRSCSAFSQTEQLGNNADWNGSSWYVNPHNWNVYLTYMGCQ